MSPPPLSPAQFRRLDSRASLYRAANDVSMKVGLILSPLLFGGVGGGLWAVIPEPAGMIIGLVIIQSGFLLMFFLLWYQRRSSRRAPFVLWGRVEAWKRVSGRHGQAALGVELQIEGAREVDAAGYGVEVPGHAGETKTLLITSPEVFESAPAGQRLLLLCMPTGEVVAAEFANALD